MFSNYITLYYLHLLINNIIFTLRNVKYQICFLLQIILSQNIQIT